MVARKKAISTIIVVVVILVVAMLVMIPLLSGDARPRSMAWAMAIDDVNPGIEYLSRHEPTREIGDDPKYSAAQFSFNYGELKNSEMYLVVWDSADKAWEIFEYYDQTVPTEGATQVYLENLTIGEASAIWTWRSEGIDIYEISFIRGNVTAHLSCHSYPEALVLENALILALAQDVKIAKVQSSLAA